MKRKLTTTIGLIAIICGLLSCKDDVDTSPLIGKTYFFRIVPHEQCTETLLSGSNCIQSINFHENGRASVIVTDIINPASFRAVGSRIFVTVDENQLFEAENPMIFKPMEDFNKLIRVSGGDQVWECDVTLPSGEGE